MNRWGGQILAAGLMALTACTTAPLPPKTVVVSAPVVRPPARITAPVAAPAPIAVAPAPAGNALRTTYARLQRDLLTRGLLRTDGGGPDTPFTDTQLARNFVRIALFSEYVAEGDLLRARATAAQLNRWGVPIRMGIEFGATVPAAQRRTDTAEVRNYAARLARVSGHPVSVTNQAPNFHVMFLNENDRRASETRLRALVPNIGRASLRAILSLPRNQLCIVVAFPDPETALYTKAIAVIRGEHPDLLRKSCIHEELAQGLGLPNDSPAARPSIFNDDEEFGLLTTHDELLLRMLYDPRLRPGMTPQEAAPIARRIATELTGGGAS